ncbi:MAG: hypothetical protein U0804_12695 [Gemmataceae bacterium]
MAKVRPRNATVNVRVEMKAQVSVTVRVKSEQERKSLKFGQGNAKLSPAITTFSLPAGHSCPFARECLSKSDRGTGIIRDGRHVRFRCYASTMEARRPSVRRARWHNYTQLRACRSAEEMARLILDSLTPFAGWVRVHDSGEFYSQVYFDAWVLVAQTRPRTTFYAYTKALPVWVRRLALVGDGYEPGEVSNLVLTASHGGTHDHIIREHRLRSARVVYSQAEADDLGLEVDHDDTHAMRHGFDFALLLHGQQPAGSEAAKAARALRDAGFAGYGKSRVPLSVI